MARTRMITVVMIVAQMMIALSVAVIVVQDAALVAVRMHVVNVLTVVSVAAAAIDRL